MSKVQHNVSAPNPSSLGIEHLLVVAAPSGAGKSTFVHLMVSAQLSPDVRACLPPDVENWRQVKGGEHYLWLAAVTQESAQTGIRGVVLDYDMTRGVVLKADYADDPALKLLKLGRTITIVNLRPPLERIISQLAYREVGANTTHNIGLQKLTWRATYMARSAVLAVAGVLPGSLFNRLKQMPGLSGARNALNVPRAKNLSAKLKHYEQSGWLDELYVRWQLYLRSLSEKGVTVHQLFLEPDTSTPEGEAYFWRLASGSVEGDIAGRR